jgi:DNA-directed RNA polymerase sigma subunit (sigma70/sigma32)
MNDSSDYYKETGKEQEQRIDDMLASMVYESTIYALKNKTPIPRFSRDEIAQYVGCSKDNIRRIEEKTLRKLQRKLAQLI